MYIVCVLANGNFIVHDSSSITSPVFEIRSCLIYTKVLSCCPFVVFRHVSTAIFILIRLSIQLREVVRSLVENYWLPYYMVEEEEMYSIV